MNKHSQVVDLDVISAVTHPDPYPFYEGLIAKSPFYYDDALKLWVASSSEAVTAVLTSDLCRVRPLSEPVPKALLGSPAAKIFQHLIRMNDGENHCPFKRVILNTLSGVDLSAVSRQSEYWARSLLSEVNQPSQITEFAFRLPTYVIGSLLGIREDQLSHVAQWIGDFARCIAPGSSAGQIEHGKEAAGELLNLFHALLGDEQIDDGLLRSLTQIARNAGRDNPDVIVANAIGFLSQAYEATAGLIGNTLLLLAVHPDIHEQIILNPVLIPQALEEVLRCDPPVQNTRRFVVEDGVLAGQSVKSGDVILLVLAAANRDPQVNPHPGQFDLFRQNRTLFTFGAGVHACPGEALATLIAKAGIEALLTSDMDFSHLAEKVTYRPSINTRIPLFN
jgi:cytochrome P450